MLLFDNLNRHTRTNLYANIKPQAYSHAQNYHFAHMLALCCLLFILSACIPAAAAGLNASQFTVSDFSSAATKVSTRKTTRATAPLPQKQTDCPASGKARAAVTASLALGSHQNLVYTYNTSKKGILRRYDTTTGDKINIVQLPDTTISNAQISTDGQYILFISQAKQRTAIQMVRIDGKSLQMLYCTNTADEPSSINNLLWSPNQKLAVFTSSNPAGAPAAPIIQLLNLDKGTLQTLVTPTGRAGYQLRAWRNNRQVYMTGYYTNDAAPPHNVYSLDVNDKSVKQVALINGYNWDANLTLNGKNLLLNQCSDAPLQGQPLPPGIISAQDATGGTLHIIYASHVYAVTQLRVFSETTLLFVLGGKFGANAQDGLWKMNLDGTGLTQLTEDGKQLSDLRTPWSSVSRDGQLYAVIGYDYSGPGDKLPSKIFLGSLQGGAAVQIAITGVGEDTSVVGWTTM